ncbi:unnamed protein product, partial [marine sediment metagenome]
FLHQLSAASDDVTQKPSIMSELNKYIHNGGFTHVLVPDEWFHKLDGTLRGCEVPVVELLGDHWIPWAVDKKKTYMKENEIKNAIVFSDRFQDAYSGMVNMHCVLGGYDSSVFRDRGVERDIDVLIHGSLGEDTHNWVYSVRNWLADVLPKIGEEEGFRVERWGHPGYWPKGERPKGNFTGAYSEVLNRAKIAIGGSSHWRLALKKFYEVPACGAILLSDLPLEDKAFFEGRVIKVDPKKVRTVGYKEELGRTIVDTLVKYEDSKEKLQPFRSEQDC